MRRFLQKMFTLHNRIQAILCIARSRRLSPILDGKSDVVHVPAACCDISIKFSQPKVLHNASLEGKFAQNVREMVYDELMSRLLAKAKEEGIEMKTKEGVAPELLLPGINVHAESSLLVYHPQHPDINSYRYIGFRVTAVSSSSAASIVSHPLSVIPRTSPKIPVG